jgi:phosphoribosylformylglycinamidine synthase
MATPKAIVVRTAGTNCDLETVFALEQAGFSADRVHVLSLIENPRPMDEAQFLVIPGGFSYGDDVAAGKILANQMLHRLADPVNRFVEAGKLVLGICNGFQVMIKSGLLPGGRMVPGSPQADATLAWNDNGRFEDRWVHLQATSDRCVFLPAGEIISLPIAHGEGKFVPAGEDVRRRLGQQDQLALKYCDAAGRPGGFPVNPNGSVDDVAGLCDPTGRVMGLMPHPERFIELHHHPTWTRSRPARADGRVFFDRARAYWN